MNILVLDTEVYSNTGGQASKATPMGAAAKFAMAGKSMPKKDLAMLAMTLRPPVRRARRDGRQGRADGERVQGGGQLHRARPSSSPTRTASRTATRCRDALGQQEKAVDSGYWPLFRYDPRRVAHGESPLKLDSPAPKIDLARFVENETRFRQVEQANPEGFKKMLAQAQKDVREKYALYEQLARAMNPANLVPGAAAADGKPPKARA